MLRNFRPSLNCCFLKSHGYARNRGRSTSSSSDRLLSIIEDKSNSSATIVLQRPPVNSLNLELLQQFTESIKKLEKDKCKGFILTSSSPNVFSAGLDIMEMYQPVEARIRQFWKSLQEMWKTLYLTPLYTVAAVNGHSPAGGCMLALSCDYSVMISSHAAIGMNETKLGIVAPKWFQKLAVNSIGFSSANKALSLGTLFTPQEALALKMVDDLAVDQNELIMKAQKQLSIALQLPGFARALLKTEMRKPFVEELNAYADQEIELIVQFIFSEGVQKSLHSYITNLKSKK